MLTQRTRDAAQKSRTATKKPAKATDHQKRGIHIVFTATIELATSKRSDTRIIGIYENVAKAEATEQQFNDAPREPDEKQQIKAHTVRYSVPYTAPMIQQMLDS